MKIINSDIKNKKFKKLYLLYGEEEYMKRYYFNALVKAISADDTMNTTRYEGKNINISEVIDMAETMPFLADYRLVILEDTGLSKSTDDKFIQYMSEIPDTTIMIFVETSVDARTKMFKTIKANGYACEFKRQTEDSLIKWAAGKLGRDGKRITVQNAEYLVSKIGDDMELLSNELDKLISYLGDKEVVDKEDINAICTTQLSVKIFDMIDAISEKNQKKTLDAYYELLATKEPPARILYMITRQFNLMLQAKDLSSRGMVKQQLAEAMGVQMFIATKSLNQSRNFTINDLRSGLSESVEIERMIKNGIVDEKIGVETLLIKYTNSK
ncbi:MAG: DNA polymerase III subunit delta [Lachnospiraceae bacterium]|nr:DNA polymerase III subunit delta [Lachnospiraceae bacterium]